MHSWVSSTSRKQFSAQIIAEVEAQTLKDPIEIKLSCTSDQGPGAMEPATLTIEDYGRVPVECTIQQQFSAGSHEAKLHADFNFETAAYRKSYFADSEDKRPGETTQ